VEREPVLLVDLGLDGGVALEVDGRDGLLDQLASPLLARPARAQAVGDGHAN
jgi:hypothetical protein